MSSYSVKLHIHASRMIDNQITSWCVNAPMLFLTINLPQLRTTWEEYLSKDCFGQCGLGTDLGTVLTVSWWGEMSPLWVALSLPRQGSWTLKDRRLGEKTQACPRQAARPGCLSSGLLASQQLTVTHNCKLSKPFLLLCCSFCESICYSKRMNQSKVLVI